MADVAALGLKVEGVESIERAREALGRFVSAGESAERSANKLGNESTKVKQSIDGVSNAAGNASGGLSAMGAAALKAGGMLAAVFSINALKNYADSWSDMKSVVGAAIGDMSGAGDMMTRLVDIANASYSPLAQTAETYSRNVSVLRDLGKTSGEAADFTESLNHMLVLTATRGERASTVQNALSKAMAVGKLQADGLETVLANGGEVARALANELGTNVNGLRQFASEGKITGDVIANAIIKSLDDVRDRAGKMPAIMGDAFTRIQNNIAKFVGKIDQATGASGALAAIIIKFANAIRVAGDYVIAFGQYAAPAFNLVQAALSMVGQYADYALVALSGFFAPALIGGVGVLTTSLAVGLVGAIKAVTAAMVANPIGLLVAALATAAYAVYQFRDEIKQAIGVDVVDVAKSAANFVVDSFTTAYDNIELLWANFGDMIGAAFIGGVNIAIDAINGLIQAAVSGINSLISSINNNIPGVKFGIISADGIGHLENSGAANIDALRQVQKLHRALANAAKSGSAEAAAAANGDKPTGATPPSVITGDGGGGSRGGGGGGANQNLSQNIAAINRLEQSIYLARLRGEELAIAQAKLSLNEYATPEQISQVESLASALYQVQEEMKKREKFGEGEKDADKYILGDTSPLSGGAFDNQIARYEAEAEAERNRYQGQMDRLIEARELQIQTKRSYDELEAIAAQQHSDRMNQIDRAKTSLMMSTASDAFGVMADIMRQSQGEQAGIYKAMFAASKAFAVANATVNAYDAISKAWASAPFPANLAAVAATAPQVMALISAISGTGVSGMAHDGIDSIPETGTWLLEKGERVVTSKTSARLDSVLERIDAQQRISRAEGTQNASNSKGITVNVIENKDRAGEVVERTNESGDQEADVFVADIFGEGKRARALEQAYGLARVGR